MDVFIKGYYMSINNPILIYVNKKRQIKLALFYSVVAIALMMSLFLNYSIMLKMMCVFFIILMIAGASAYWYSAFSGKPQLTLNQEGVTLHTTRLPIVYWHEIDYVGERVSDNTPVLAIFIKDVELYCQRITNEKMRNNFLSLLNKHGSNRVMNISLNDLEYDSDELQDIFKMAVARNLEQ
ncbi:hypothetical protein J9I48_002988 [Salmonella enterica]|nr:hypothetical protein [Salmonella enterica]